VKPQGRDAFSTYVREKKRCQLQNEEPKILASSHAEKAMQNQKWQKSFDQKMKL